MEPVEPEELLCPISRTVFRDPVVVVESGHTYERSAIVSHFRRNGASDPLTVYRGLSSFSGARPLGQSGKEARAENASSAR